MSCQPRQPESQRSSLNNRSELVNQSMTRDTMIELGSVRNYMETSQKRRATKKALITIQLKHLKSVDWSTKLIKRESHLNTAPPWPPCIQNNCTLTKSVLSQWLSSTWGKGLSRRFKEVTKESKDRRKSFSKRRGKDEKADMWRHKIEVEKNSTDRHLLKSKTDFCLVQLASIVNWTLQAMPITI